MEDMFKCGLCETNFSSYGELNNHCRNTFHYRNIVRKPFACNFCGKRFPKKWQKLNHQKTHRRKNSSKKKNNVRDVWVSTHFCRKCEYKSHTKSKLNKHINETHNEKSK